MEYFKNIPDIKYEGQNSENMFSFRHYNPEEVVMGKPMKEHLKFAVAYWHTFNQDGSDPFGGGTNVRNWNGKTPMETAKNKVDAAFEFFKKLGVE